MVLEDETSCGPRESSQPNVHSSDCVSSFLPPSSVAHLPIHPSSLLPCQPLASTYPALQLFYLLPGEHHDSPPVLVPVTSSLPHQQPLFLPALTCGPPRQTHLEVRNSSLESPSERREESCFGSQAPSKSREEFFRPWENACSVTVLSEPKQTDQAASPKFRPWEQASPPTLLHKDAKEDDCVTDMMKGMVIGHPSVINAGRT